MKAAVLEAIRQPLRIMDLDVPPLQHGQVLVRMLATGICGAQLQEIDGLKGDPSHCPHLLGHEGCGIVQEIGRGVTTVECGDKVVIHWRKGAVGLDVDGATFGGIKSGPCTTFSEDTIISENRATHIPHDVPNDFGSLLGCCLSTALAIVENESNIANVKTAFVIGCGGVGLALIVALKSAGVSHVFAMDISGGKLPIVDILGAYFSLNLVRGADLVIDTTGNYRDLPTKHYISLQKGGTEGGGFNPTKDIPRYVQMWRDGKLRGWEKIITHRIKLDQINKGIQLMRGGKAGRVLIDFI